MSHLFKLQVNMLGLLEAKKKVYVFRIDIWMNIFLSDDVNLSKEFY